MNKITEWLAIWFRPQAQTQHPLHAALDEGRRLKFAEDTEGSLAAFDRARTLLEPGDSQAATAIALHKVEVLIEAERFDEAAALIETTEATARTPAERAYLVNGRGMLAQARGDLDAARTHYEAARTAARAVLLVGAEGRAACHLADAVLRDGNASYAVHLLKENMPRLHTAGDLEWSCHFVGAYGEALMESGQIGEGVDMVRSALALSESISYQRYERRWARALGDHAFAEGRYHDAETHIARALKGFKPSPPVQRHLRHEYVALLRTSASISLALRDVDAACKKAEEAVLALPEDERYTSPTGLASLGVLGMALVAANQPAEALLHLPQAAATGSVEVMRALAAAYHAVGNTAEAEATYAAALGRAAASPASAALETAQVQRDMGLVYYKAGRYADAITAWTHAVAGFDSAKARSQIARLYADLGNARRALGQHARAMKDYETALMHLNTLDEFDTETRGVVLANAAVASADAGDTDSADSFFSESIAIAERAGHAAAEAIRLGNYGWFLAIIGKPRRAIASLERGLVLCEKLELHPHFAVQTDNMGLAYDALTEYTTALDWHRRALARLDAVAYPAWAATFALNTAHTLIALGDADAADLLLAEAIAYTRQDSAASETLIRGLAGNALIAVIRGTPADADAVLTEAIALARRVDHRRGLAEALAVRSRQQAALGDRAAAAAAWDEATRIYTRLHMPQARVQPAWLEG